MLFNTNLRLIDIKLLVNDNHSVIWCSYNGVVYECVKICDNDYVKCSINYFHSCTHALYLYMTWNWHCFTGLNLCREHPLPAIKYALLVQAKQRPKEFQQRTQHFHGHRVYMLTFLIGRYLAEAEMEDKSACRSHSPAGGPDLFHWRAPVSSSIRVWLN